MLGAIYGDKAGSVYEFAQLKEIKSINPNKLITPESFYSDDTIETICKKFNVRDNFFVSEASNSIGTSRNMVLRAVYEY